MSEHHHHSHDTEDVSDGVLLWTVIVNLGLSVFQFAAGAVAGSVALMADALHNTNDAGSLLIAYVARRISRRGADERYTFGYRRAELIGAMIQLTALILVGLYLVVEAGRRFLNPEPPLAGWMMVAAGVALVVDMATAWLLWSMSKGSLNVRAAFLHNLTDAGASLAVLLGGVAIWKVDWIWVDPALTLGIAGYILWMSVGLLKTTSRILMEGAPPDFPFDELSDTLKKIEGISDFHHLHIWELDENHRALEAHLVIDPESEDTPAARQKLRQRVKSTLSDTFGIAHSTLEIETLTHACEEEHSHGKVNRNLDG